MTPIEQAIYDSSYAMTERERNIATEFYERGMKQKPQPAGQSVEELAKEISVGLYENGIPCRGSREAIVNGLVRSITPFLQSFTTSQQQAREELEKEVALLRQENKTVWLAHSKMFGECASAKGGMRRDLDVAKAAVKTLRGALERLPTYNQGEPEMKAKALESTKEFA